MALKHITEYIGTEDATAGTLLIPKTILPTMIEEVDKALLPRELAKVVLMPGSIPGSAVTYNLETANTMDVRVVGEGFARGEYFLPDLVMAGDAMKNAMKLVENELKKTGKSLKTQGVIVIGTVAGDIHDIGKTLVATLLASDGFEVIDIGVDINANKFVEAVRTYKPHILAVEDLFFFKNLKTAIKVAEARGVILLTAIENKLDIYEFTPLQIKQALVGYGRADKKQIQHMVKVILNLKQIPQPDDAADAVAVAICCAHSLKSQKTLKH